jgi:hypothetical protein
MLGVALTGLSFVSLWMRIPVFGLALGLISLSLAALLFPQLAQWLPERQCQVTAGDLFRFSRSRAALQWGVRLGLGICTYLVTPAMLALIALTLVQTPPLLSIVICFVYGVLRGATIALAAIRKSQVERQGRLEKPPLRVLRSLRVPSVLVVALATFALILQR